MMAAYRTFQASAPGATASGDDDDGVVRYAAFGEPELAAGVPLCFLASGPCARFLYDPGTMASLPHLPFPLGVWVVCFVRRPLFPQRRRGVAATGAPPALVL